jgi:hypothetical protein
MIIFKLSRSAVSDLFRVQRPIRSWACAKVAASISRWGRFQDIDESAHYEFLCRSARIPVHYCAEQFSNDGSIASSIMKTFKRTMAAEYSRELGVKVLAGQQRIARL